MSVRSRSASRRTGLVTIRVGGAHPGRAITSRRGSDEIATTGTSGHPARICSARASPFTSGMRTSTATTSAEAVARCASAAPAPSTFTTDIPQDSARSPSALRAAALSSTTSSRRPATRIVRPTDRTGVHVGQAEREVEGAPAARYAVALDPDRAGHQLGQPTADGQTEAGAAVAPAGRGVCLAEVTEEAWDVLRGSVRCRCRVTVTCSSVARSSSRCTAPAPKDDLAGVRELHRVVEQVQQHLPQPACVARPRSAGCRARARHASSRPLRSPGARSGRPPTRCSPRLEGSRARAPCGRPRSSRSPGCR